MQALKNTVSNYMPSGSNAGTQPTTESTSGAVGNEAEGQSAQDTTLPVRSAESNTLPNETHNTDPTSSTTPASSEAMSSQLQQGGLDRPSIGADDSHDTTDMVRNAPGSFDEPDAAASRDPATAGEEEAVLPKKHSMPGGWDTPQPSFTGAVPGSAAQGRSGVEDASLSNADASAVEREGEQIDKEDYGLGGVPKESSTADAASVEREGEQIDKEEYGQGGVPKDSYVEQIKKAADSESLPSDSSAPSEPQQASTSSKFNEDFSTPSQPAELPSANATSQYSGPTVSNITRSSDPVTSTSASQSNGPAELDATEKQAMSREAESAFNTNRDTIGLDKEQALNGDFADDQQQSGATSIGGGVPSSTQSAGSVGREAGVDAQDASAPTPSVPTGPGASGEEGAGAGKTDDLLNEESGASYDPANEGTAATDGVEEGHKPSLGEKVKNMLHMNKH